MVCFNIKMFKIVLLLIVLCDLDFSCSMPHSYVSLPPSRKASTTVKPVIPGGYAIINAGPNCDTGDDGKCVEVLTFGAAPIAKPKQQNQNNYLQNKPVPPKKSYT